MENLTPIDNYTTNEKTFQDKKQKTLNLSIIMIIICVTLILVTLYIKFKFPSLFAYLSDIYKKYFEYQSIKIKYILQDLLQKLSIRLSEIDFSILDKFSKNINL